MATSEEIAAVARGGVGNVANLAAQSRRRHRHLWPASWFWRNLWEAKQVKPASWWWLGKVKEAQLVTQVMISFLILNKRVISFFLYISIYLSIYQGFAEDFQMGVALRNFRCGAKSRWESSLASHPSARPCYLPTYISIHLNNSLSIQISI